MEKVKTPTVRSKAMRGALEYLGPDYGLKTIDGEVCVYRGFGNGFDIEVSGVVRRGKRNSVCSFICVWWRACRSVEYVREPKDLSQLKCILDELARTYGGPDAKCPDKDLDRTAEEFLEGLER